MSRATFLKTLATIGGAVAQGLLGALFIAGGAYIVFISLAKEDHKLVYVGIGTALFGALIFPSIFPLFQRVYVLVFPNGLPIIGGRRANDPPAPPPVS